MLDLEPIKARCQAATAAPWKNGNPGQIIFHDGKLVAIVPIQKQSDAAFIAQARQDIPVLILELELYREEVSKLAKDNERLRVERNQKSINFGSGPMKGGVGIPPRTPPPEPPKAQGRDAFPIPLRNTTIDGIPVAEYRWGDSTSVYVDDKLTEDSYDDAVEKLKAGVD